MSARKKRYPQQQNHERWIVSYADFVTLLFAFFVVMYSISSVNEGKYRVLSQTLTDAFQEPVRSIDPLQIGELSRKRGDVAGHDSGSSLIRMERSNELDVALMKEQQNNAVKMNSLVVTQKQSLNFLAYTIEDILDIYVKKDLVEVTFDGNRVLVNIKDRMLFPSGRSHLSRDAVNVLRDLSSVLANIDNQIQVEGNTDNRPIHTEEYPSNWELSAARAASVVHLMTRMGIAPNRLSAVGYGQYRPIASNDTEEGRQKNRRVTLIVEGIGDFNKKTFPLSGDRE